MQDLQRAHKNILQAFEHAVTLLRLAHGAVTWCAPIEEVAEAFHVLDDLWRDLNPEDESGISDEVSDAAFEAARKSLDISVGQLAQTAQHVFAVSAHDAAWRIARRILDKAWQQRRKNSYPGGYFDDTEAASTIWTNEIVPSLQRIEQVDSKQLVQWMEQEYASACSTRSAQQEQPPQDESESAAVADFIDKLTALSANERSYILRMYLFLYAQAYYNITESSIAPKAGYVDTHLNSYYLRTVKAIKDLLTKPELQGFPGGFEPIVEDVFPSGDWDIGWDDYYAPRVREFLSRAQAFLEECDPTIAAGNVAVEGCIAVCIASCKAISGAAAEHRKRAEASLQNAMKQAKGTAQKQEDQVAPTCTVEQALQDLQRAVEKHRLTFLYFANPRRVNPNNRDELWGPSMPENELPNIPPEVIDTEGNFLFKYRFNLDLFAQNALRRFGGGKGNKPSVPGPDGRSVEVEGGRLPWWTLEAADCSHLEDSADAILKACKVLARTDTAYRFESLIRKARCATHDQNQPRWNCSIGVRWEYLSQLDELIASVKVAEFDYDDRRPLPANRFDNADVDSTPSERASMPAPCTLEQALLSLQHVVEKHRLTFLYGATAKRHNPLCLGPSKQEVLRPDRYERKPQIPSEVVDESGDFLFQYQHVLEKYADDAVAQFGPGSGCKPIIPGPDEGEWLEVENGGLPVWSLDEVACGSLETSSDAILEACKLLVKLDSLGRFRSSVQEVRQIAHGEGQSKWYSSILVKWDYLSKLDAVIKMLKGAEMDHYDKPLPLTEPSNQTLADRAKIAAPAIEQAATLMKGQLAPTGSEQDGATNTDVDLGGPYPWDDIEHLRSVGVMGRLLCKPSPDEVLRTIRHWDSLPNYVQHLEQEGYRWGGISWAVPEDGTDRSLTGCLASAALHHLFETIKDVIAPELERTEIGSSSFLRASDMMWRFAHEWPEPAASWGCVQRYAMWGNKNLPPELAVETLLPADDLKTVMQAMNDLDVLKARLEAETRYSGQARTVPTSDRGAGDADSGNGSMFARTCTEEAKLRGCKPWELAKERAERYVRHVGSRKWPGLNVLAKYCRCHHSVLKQALENSDLLQAKEAEYRRERAKPPAKQQAVDDPQHQAIVDETLNQLRQLCTSDERNALNKPEAREQLLQMKDYELNKLVEDAKDRHRQRMRACARTTEQAIDD